METINLTESAVWSTEINHGGVEIHVLAGTAWVTQEADPEDHVLVAPAVFTAQRRGRLVMAALAPTIVQVERVGHPELRSAA